jgi:hypothetical protein
MIAAEFLKQQHYLAFNSYNTLFRNFVGWPHWRSILRMVGKDHICVILGELGKNVELLVCTSFFIFFFVSHMRSFEPELTS